MKKETNKQKEVAKKMIAGACEDRDCPIHGSLRARGRTFQGTVIKKFPRRIVIQFERMTYVQKYERYSKSRTKLHARVPQCMEESVKVGDYVQIKETRPLSKIIHFVITDVIRKAEEKKQ
jgi:small subunit ribosomal protein S17